MNKLLKVKCPQCEKEFSYYESEYRPFCTERCKMIDLGHWFEESYRVPAKEKDNNQKELNEDSNQGEEQGESHETFNEDYEDDENNY